MGELELAQIEARCAAATEGPRLVGTEAEVYDGERYVYVFLRTSEKKRFDDCELHRCAWQDLMALTAEVRRLKQLHEIACERIAVQSELLSKKAEQATSETPGSR